MKDIEKAISDISDIRSQLAASTRFRGYAPEAVATIGLVSLAVIVAQYVWPETLATSNVQMALVWGGILLINTFAIAIETVARARKQHGGMASAMLRGAMFTAFPISFIGIVLGVVVLRHAPEIAWLLPPTWQMLVGVVGFSSHSILPRRIVWPATMYLLSGGAVALWAARGGVVTPLMAGGPYVVGHFWIARILKNEGALSR